MLLGKIKQDQAWMAGVVLQRGDGEDHDFGLSFGSHLATPRHLSSHGTSHPHGLQGRNPQVLFPLPRSPFPLPGSVLLPNSLSPVSTLSSQHILPTAYFPCLSLPIVTTSSRRAYLLVCLLTALPLAPGMMLGMKSAIMKCLSDFPGSPLAKILHCQCRGHGFKYSLCCSL